MRSITATLFAVAAIAMTSGVASAASNGTGKFCLRGGPDATLNCQYQTMAMCEKAKTGTETCVQNPSSTTGSGMGSSNSSNPASTSPMSK